MPLIGMKTFESDDLRATQDRPHEEAIEGVEETLHPQIVGQSSVSQSTSRGVRLLHDTDVVLLTHPDSNAVLHRALRKGERLECWWNRARGQRLQRLRTSCEAYVAAAPCLDVQGLGTFTNNCDTHPLRK